MNFIDTNKHVFFVGIGGIGMSGLAEILLEQGYKVSGSDRTLSEITDYLSAKGATIYEGHSRENLKKIDLLVYSSAVPQENPERQEARKQKTPEIRRAEMLADIMRMKFGVAIAGTHGKTSTTSMAATVVSAAGVDPTIVVGGRLHSMKTNAKLGKGEILITEADEYDRSFLALSPAISIITNIDSDHLDIYKDFEDIKNTFVEFANRTAFYGNVICCIDDEGVRQIIKRINKPVITYGTQQQAEFSAGNFRFSGFGSEFTVFKRGEKIGQIILHVPGEHNIKNALAVISLGKLLHIPFEIIQNALEEYRGVERRFELIGSSKGISVIDDYAHHPAEVKATIKGARNGFSGRIVAVFQPHLFSRTKDFYRAFANELCAADMVVVTDVYPAREKPITGITGKLIVDEIKKQGFDKVFYKADKNEIAAFLIPLLKENDIVITLGAGDINKVGKEMMHKLNA